ncbi:MAG: hypothetical protein IJT72_00815 [Lachnospiraceae bacterium]|nr:hypothetical protein [Lachnospiraceae bacterium]
MKKKIIALFLVCIMLLSFTGCGESKKIDSEPDGTPDDTEYSVIGGGQNRSTEESTSQTTDTTETNNNSDANVKVTPTENASITWTSYTTPEGYMTLDIPQGWEVMNLNIDVIGYLLLVYDPNSVGRRFFFSTAVTSYPSQDEWAWWRQTLKEYSGVDYGENWYISPQASTQSLFENSGGFFGYTNFNVIDNLGQNGYGGDVLQATCTLDGINVEGVFSAAVVDMPVQLSPYLADGSMDLVEGTVIMTAPEEEYTNWEGVLGQMFASLTFSDQYWTDRAAMQRQMQQTANYLSYQADVMSDMIMDTWEKRSNSYDIQSQQYSDATLGRERIYDTETGEVYYADNGWSDGYYGNRYQLVTPGSELYNLPVTGTISY